MAQARLDGSTGWSGPGRSAEAPRTIPYYPETVAAEEAKSYAPLPASTVSASTPDGFDWGDSAAGAGVAFAVILLAAGTLVTIQRAGHRATTT